MYFRRKIRQEKKISFTETLTRLIISFQMLLETVLRKYCVLLSYVTFLQRVLSEDLYKICGI